MEINDEIIDLFDHYELLPKNVQKILSKYEQNSTYTNCEKLIKQLNKVGPS